MQCPYCNSEMKKGITTGDGRSMVRWCQEGEKMLGAGMIDAKYGLANLRLKVIIALNVTK